MLPILDRTVSFYNRQIEGKEICYLKIDHPLDRLSSIDRPANQLDKHNYQLEWAKYISQPKPEIDENVVAQAQELVRNKEQNVIELTRHISELQNKILNLQRHFLPLEIHNNNLLSSKVISTTNAPLYVVAFDKFKTELNEVHDFVTGKSK